MRYRIPATLAASAAVLVLATPTAIAAPSASPDSSRWPTSSPSPAPAPPPGLAEAVRRDLDLSWTEFEARGALAARARTLQSGLAQTPGFVEFRIQDNQLVAIGSGREFAAAAKSAGIRSFTGAVQPSLSELTDEIRGLAGNRLVSVERSTQGPVITLTPDADAELVRQVSHIAPDAKVVRADRATPRLAVEGGQRTHFAGTSGNDSWCLTGFAVHTSTAQPGVVTAGHCTRDGQNATIKVDNPVRPAPGVPETVLGTLTFNQFGGPNNAPVDPNDIFGNPTGTDLAIVTTGTGITTTGTVPAGSTASPAGAITGTAQAVLGGAACAYRHTLGWHCGTIETTEKVVFLAGPSGDDLRAVKVFDLPGITVEDGDSGGPVITGTKALGLTVAQTVDNGEPLLHAVPITALDTHAPNTGVQLWVPQPSLNNTQQAGPNHATADWTPSQAITGQIAVPAGESGTAYAIQLRIDQDTPVTLTPDAAGAFGYTLPSGMSAAPAIHTVTVTAHRGPDTSAQFTVHLPYIVDGLTRDRWLATGGPEGPLGAPTGPKTCGLRDGGCKQPFQGGQIAWTSATGAHAVYGAIGYKWGETNSQDGILGYPTGDEACGLVRGGCWQSFQYGAILWQPQAGAHYNLGRIRDKYGDLNWENGIAGYPITDEICASDHSHCYQQFDTENTSIHWYADNNTAYYTRGIIATKWAQIGGNTSPVGRLNSDEICGMLYGGCRQHFRTDGAIIYWDGHAGNAFYTRGAILTRWGQLGWETGDLGYPTTDEECGLYNGGCWQGFGTASNTTISRRIYWSGATGAHDILHAGILEQYVAQGVQNGALRYPTSNPQIVQGSNPTRYAQQFQGGTLTTTKG